MKNIQFYACNAGYMQVVEIKLRTIDVTTNKPTTDTAIILVGPTDVCMGHPGMLTRPEVTRPRPRPRPEVTRPRPRPRPEVSRGHKAKAKARGHKAKAKA